MAVGRKPTSEALSTAQALGRAEYMNELLQSQLDQARARLNPPLSKKFWYWICNILIFGVTVFIFYLAGQYQAVTLLSTQQAPSATVGVSRPTVPIPTARIEPPQAPAAVIVVESPTPAWPDDGGADLQQPSGETPLPGEFWTESEKATFVAVDATKTAEAVIHAEATAAAFVAPENVPTPAPEVVEMMDEKCADAALVAASPLLQLWCVDD